MLALVFPYVCGAVIALVLTRNLDHAQEVPEAHRESSFALGAESQITRLSRCPPLVRLTGMTLRSDSVTILESRPEASRAGVSPHALWHGIYGWGQAGPLTLAAESPAAWRKARIVSR